MLVSPAGPCEELAAASVGPADSATEWPLIYQGCCRLALRSFRVKTLSGVAGDCANCSRCVMVTLKTERVRHSLKLQLSALPAI